MRILRNLTAAVGIALSLLAAVSQVAFALTNPPSFNPRVFPTQQVHYQRFTVAFNSCTYVSLVCSVKVGAIPYNAFIARIFAQTTTTWNAGTSASIGLGTVTPAVNLLASTNFTTAAAGAAQTVVSANVGLAVTGNGIAQSGTNGGFDVFATITIVGSLPTAGQTTFIVEYFAPNDGTCIAVPLGSTSPAC
jgi:hypothetical protein